MGIGNVSSEIPSIGPRVARREPCGRRGCTEGGAAFAFCLIAARVAIAVTAECHVPPEMLPLRAKPAAIYGDGSPAPRAEADLCSGLRCEVGHHVMRNGVEAASVHDLGAALSRTSS